MFLLDNRCELKGCLTSESVQCAALTLEGIDNIHGGDSLPLGVFGVGDGITDDVLKEDLEDSSGLLIDEARDTLDTSAASQSTDGRLGDTLDVITQHFAMTLGASLAESLSSFASSGHVECFLFELSKKNDISNNISAAYIATVGAVSARECRSHDQMLDPSMH